MTRTFQDYVDAAWSASLEPLEASWPDRAWLLCGGEPRTRRKAREVSMSDSKDRAQDAPTNVTDVVDTLNRLARACTDCGAIPRDMPIGNCMDLQRRKLLLALPEGPWDETAETLRSMADRVAALEAEVARLRGGA